jgi:hypothetical protein
MVCLRNISVDTVHKGDTEDDDDYDYNDDDDDDNNNNNNNNNMLVSQNGILAARKFKLYKYQSKFPSIIWSVNITFLYLQIFSIILYKNPTNALTHFRFC